ncbi:hypothetical protein [Cohnella rhizosphaerae]|uniref:hypothetical protein n=1 Tax=Cohnella rhizosphaerae TaxID=1457232 RepID=UPI0030B8C8A4
MLGYESSELADRHVESILSVANRLFFHTYFYPYIQLYGQVKQMYLALRTKDGRNLPRADERRSAGARRRALHRLRRFGDEQAHRARKRHFAYENAAGSALPGHAGGERAARTAPCRIRGQAAGTASA